MGPVIDEDLWRRRLASLGLPDAEPVGRGVEGVVFRVGGGRVAKVWSARQAPELELMRAFYADLDAARPAIATPPVDDVLLADGAVVTVERELRGRPLPHPGRQLRRGAALAGAAAGRPQRSPAARRAA